MLFISGKSALKLAISERCKIGCRLGLVLGTRETSVRGPRQPLRHFLILKIKKQKKSLKPKKKQKRSMSNQAELVGKAVDNKWHILKKIGSGSFGQVFIGWK